MKLIFSEAYIIGLLLFGYGIYVGYRSNNAYNDKDGYDSYNYDIYGNYKYIYNCFGVDEDGHHYGSENEEQNESEERKKFKHFL